MPLRKCVACGEQKAKQELIRVVRQGEGQVEVDLTGKMNGRGAYICSSIDCLNIVKNKNQLSKALKTEVANEVFGKLEEVINKEK